MIRVTIDYSAPDHEVTIAHEASFVEPRDTRLLADAAARELVRAVWGADTERRVFDE